MGPEGKLESKCLRYARSQGCRFLKYSNAAQGGYNDRILIIPGVANGGDASYIWVELKAPGKKPTPRQRFRHEQLRELGCRTEVFDDADEFKKFLDAELRRSASVPG